MTVAEPSIQPAGIPPAEIEVDSHLIRTLLRAQHPHLADLTLAHVATGWDNTTFRLGDRLAVRVPRIKAAVALIRKEQRWLPELATRLPIPIPVPVAVGQPSAEFPWPWSVVPWVPGRSAEREPLSASEASRFGQFLAALHQPAPRDAPRNDYRGVPLAQVASVGGWLDRLARTETGLDVPLDVVRERWHEAQAVPVDVEDTWVHGDLHPKNLVVDSGRLASVLDWGDMTVGDRAADLGATWMLFPTAGHADVWRVYGAISSRTMARAKGWALFFGTALLDTGLANDPPFAMIGRHILERACAE